MTALDEARITLDLLRAPREGWAGLERRRRERLDGLLDHAARHSRFYSRLYRGQSVSARNLSGLPAVTKPELMGAFDEWVTDPAVTRARVERFVEDPRRIGEPFLGRYFVSTSSGTTGHPGLYVHDPGAIAVARASVIRLDLAWLSAAQWVALAAKGFRWAAVVGTGAHFGGVGWIEFERRRSWWRRHAFRVFSVQQPLEDLAAALEAFDPAILTGYPSVLLQLAELADSGRLNLAPTALEMAGESAGPAARARISRALGAQLHDVYAASECHLISYDCAQGWLHLAADWVVLEPVGDDLEPTPAGEESHTVLLTNLANHVQPIIRYDLGDSVLMRPEPCACGNPMPAMRVAGRRDDVLRLRGAGGREVEVLPLAISAVVEQVRGIRRSQVVQTGSTALSVRLDPSPGASGESAWKALSDALRQYLESLGLGNVTLALADQPPESSARSGKFRQVIGARSGVGV
jgi:phenylacetate-CoA ligase